MYAALDAGAAGLLTAAAGDVERCSGVRRVLGGEVLIPETAGRIPERPIVLGFKEQLILNRLAQGLPNKAIAQQEDISVRTVASHLPATTLANATFIPSDPLDVLELGVPHYLPQVPVWVAEVARVNAPGPFVRRGGHRRSGCRNRGQQGIHRLLRGHGVAQAEFAGFGRSKRRMGILGQLGTGIEGQDQAPVQVKDRDGPRRVGLVAGELRTDHTLRWQPEAIAVEGERASEIVDGQGDYVNACRPPVRESVRNPHE